MNRFVRHNVRKSVLYNPTAIVASLPFQTAPEFLLYKHYSISVHGLQNLYLDYSLFDSFYVPTTKIVENKENYGSIIVFSLKITQSIHYVIKIEIIL